VPLLCIIYDRMSGSRGKQRAAEEFPGCLRTPSDNVYRSDPGGYFAIIISVDASGTYAIPARPVEKFRYGVRDWSGMFA